MVSNLRSVVVLFLVVVHLARVKVGVGFVQNQQGRGRAGDSGVVASLLVADSDLTAQLGLEKASLVR